MRRLFADITPTRRRLFADIKPPVTRRLFADIEPPITRRLFADIRTPYQRYVADPSHDRPGRSMAKPHPCPEWRSMPEPSYAPPDYSDSVFRRWAARFFHTQRWRALPHQSVDDLLQDSYFKYVRCIQLYVYERRKPCDYPNQLMNYFKSACNNMLTDESRKKQRHPEKYRELPFDTTNEIDCALELDNSFLVATETSLFGFEV